MKLKDVVLITDDNYLPVLMQLLNGARSRIDILAYSFAMGNGKARGAPYQIAQKLAELKKKYGRKLKIRLYIEGERETSERNRVTAEFLRKHGILVKYGATHAKGFAVDGRYVLFGSTNLTNQSIVKNNETNLLLQNPKVNEGFETYFEHLWKGGRHGGVQLPPPLIVDGKFKDSLLKLIGRAKSRLEFSIYFFHHSEIERALLAAAARGVKVSGFFHKHNSFALSYVRRTLGTAGRLRDGGIAQIFVGPPHLFTHSKYIIADRKEILLGTGNWLHEDVKVHPQLYIEFENAALARELAKHLRAQIKNQGTQV